MPINTIIIDDDDACREVLAKLILGLDNLMLIGSFSSAEDALDLIKGGNVELILLDVEMPEMTGLEFLSNLQIKPQVIITASNKKYAFEAFDYEVLDYLLKPITLSRLIKAVSKAEKNVWKIHGFDLSKNKDFVFIKNDSVLNKILIKDVLWIEALGDYVKVYTRDKKYVLHLTLKKLEDKLPIDKFLRVHRSYIVQLDNIRTVEDNAIFITDVSIPIGALYKHDLLDRLNLLM